MARLRLLAAALTLSGLAVSIPAAHAQSTTATTPSAQSSDAQDHQAHHPATEPAQPAKAADGPMGGMQNKMMADMQAGDAKISALVAKMNAARGDAKVDAIAEVVTAIAEQHKAMCEGMMQMQGQMMMPMHEQMMKPMGNAR